MQSCGPLAPATLLPRSARARWLQGSTMFLARRETVAAHDGSGMRFEPLYHADRLRIINPLGDIGIVTLWSRVEQALEKLQAIRPELVDPSRSRIAAISNLYGD